MAAQHVFGNVDQHGAGSPGGGDVECLGQYGDEIGGFGHQDVVLGDRGGDAGDVGFLKGVGADGVAWHLPVMATIGTESACASASAMTRFQGARTRGGQTDPDFSGGLGIPSGGVAGALFVADQNMTDHGRFQQRVIHRQDGAAENAEHAVHAEQLQDPYYCLRAREHVAMLAGWMVWPWGCGAVMGLRQVGAFTGWHLER